MTKDKVRSTKEALSTARALKLALEALELANVNHWWGSSSIENAITAIKEALAQPEYQSTADKSKLEKVPAKGTLLAQPEQEPVAYLKFWAYQRVSPDGDVDADEGLEVCRKNEVGDDGQQAFPVYTTPPKRKPLTDEEILQTAHKRHARINNNIGNDLLLISFARAIEAAHGIIAPTELKGKA